MALTYGKPAPADTPRHGIQDWLLSDEAPALMPRRTSEGMDDDPTTEPRPWPHYPAVCTCPGCCPEKWALNAWVREQAVEWPVGLCPTPADIICLKHLHITE